MRWSATVGSGPGLRRDDGSWPSGHSAQHGFTLVEMMVALLIFGMLAAAGVALFGGAVRAQGAAAARLDADAGEQRLVALLTADLAQAQARVWRGEDGGARPAFGGSNGVGAAPVLSFVRGGVTGSEAIGQSALRRVDWRVRDGRLERVAYARVDGASEGQAVVLATGVTRVTMRYRDQDWGESWQPTRADLLPRAVEMTLSRDKRPDLTIAALVGSRYP
ncbi:Type II secretion system protein J [Sphingomonas antarctica]|uniref:type II secretion system minor pseudopilin GspJ n=1 Tax=Sphingomonas antarctica TaxID=2040274 RepID=UPI0039E7B3DC